MSVLSAQLCGQRGKLAIEVAFDTRGGPLALVGPNGAGKSSVLAMLLGALRPEAGQIALDDAVLFDRAAGIDVPLEARRIGYLPQDYGLFPQRSARRNVEFALSCMRPKLDRASLHARCAAILAELKLEPLADRPCETLSGGERQRVALARALSVTPRALLLDEPLAALDLGARAEVRAFLARYLRDLGLATIVVTHDPADALALGHRIAVLDAGQLVQLGSIEELAARPASAFVERFVALADASK